MANRVERHFEGEIPVIGEDGRRTTISLFVNYTIFQPLSGAAARLPGAYSLELPDGSTVALLEENAGFRVDDTGETLRFDD